MVFKVFKIEVLFLFIIIKKYCGFCIVVGVTVKERVGRGGYLVLI